MPLENLDNVPLPLAVWLATDDYDHNPDPRAISATTLLKPLKQLIMSRRAKEALKAVGEEPTIDIMKLRQSRIGSSLHDSIERAWVTNYEKALLALGYPEDIVERVIINPTSEQLAQLEDPIAVYMEQREEKEIAGYIVTGKYDFIGEGMVQDFKSTGTFTYTKGVNDEKYIQQGSIYRWLNPEIITEDVMQIHFIFTDWKKFNVGVQQNYPPKPLMSVELPLMPLEETEQFINDRIHAIEIHKDLPEEELPECTDEELWRDPPVYKYFAKKDSKRSAKNFDIYSEALAYVQEKGKPGGELRTVYGQAKACNFCDAQEICEQRKNLVARGELATT